MANIYEEGNVGTENIPRPVVDLPAGYGDNKIVLMIRDPWTVFAYWEIHPDVEAGVLREIEARGLKKIYSVLRVYDVTAGLDQAKLLPVQEYELRDWADKWYIHFDSTGRTWICDIGILCEGGEYFPLARSNAVTTPRHSMSDKFDERWMCPEELYRKMYEASGAGEIGSSSLGLREKIEHHIRSWLFSGGVSSESISSTEFLNRK